MAKVDIRLKAGDVFLLLLDRGILTVKEIGNHMQDKEGVVFLAIGWLLKENKVRCFDRNGATCVELNNPVTEIYY